jgi:FkbM family methyltransferase
VSDREYYNEKKRLILVDTYNSGADYLDPIFDENKVELSELFTFDGKNGISVYEIPNYTGWDYVVITYLPNILEQLKALVNALRIPTEKVIYLSPNGIQCEDYKRIDLILSPSYLKALKYFEKNKEYDSKIIGDYITLTLDGVSYINSSSDTIIMKYMYLEKKNYAKDTMDVFISLAQKKYEFSEEQDIFCDIGANIGTTSIYFKKKIDPLIKILAFEPARMNYKLLRANMLLNDIGESECTIVKSALSDEKGISEFAYDSTNPGGSSLIAENVINSMTEEVEVIPFDDYIEENSVDIKRIKYIWIDVEGFEPAFFQGARRTLDMIDVPTITEFTPALYKKTGQFTKFVSLLNTLYKTFIIVQDKNLTEQDIRELEKYADYEDQMDLMLFK